MSAGSRAPQAGGGLVYSTEGGRMCPGCRQPVADCACRRQAAPAPGNGVIKVACVTKGRGGKAVTVVRGLPLQDAALALLGKQLRTACGAGGTVKDGVVELQGDHVERVVSSLEGQGWKVRRTAG